MSSHDEFANSHYGAPELEQVADDLRAASKAISTWATWDYQVPVGCVMSLLAELEMAQDNIKSAQFGVEEVIERFEGLAYRMIEEGEDHIFDPGVEGGAHFPPYGVGGESPYMDWPDDDKDTTTGPETPEVELTPAPQAIVL